MDAGIQQYPSDAPTQQLADLFRQNLKLSVEAGEQTTSSDLPVQPYNSDQNSEPPIQYNISQHYTHTAHVAPALHPLQPSVQDHASRLLIQNDIPPSSLLRSQFELFERSNVDQQAKLAMLWRLAPPNHGRHGHAGQELYDNLGEYQTTTFEREEGLAWSRYQRMFSGRDIKRDVKAEEIGGRQSLLGEYFQRDPDETSTRRPPVPGNSEATDQLSSSIVLPGSEQDGASQETQWPWQVLSHDDEMEDVL